MGENILIVDDEKELADLVELYLKNDGYQVTKCYSTKEALEAVSHEEIGLALLDVMLPDVNGFDLCKKIREKYLFPIIMLTARVEDMDKITGLTLGADDYITKPFNPLELVARVKTQLRRYKLYNGATSVSGDPSEYDNKGLYICPGSHKCTLNCEDLPLTPMEFDILWLLCQNHGMVVSAERLFEGIWKEKYLERDNNTVMAHIARIREKMHEPPRKPQYIKTVWGVGYVIE